MEREGLGALKIQPGGTGEDVCLWPGWNGQGLNSSPVLQEEFLAVFPPCHIGFGLVFFLAGSEPSPPRGLGESPETRAGH